MACSSGRWMAEGRRHGDARSRRLAGHASACAAMPSCAVPRSEPASQGRPAGGPGRLPWRPAERAPRRCAAHGGFESRVTVVVCGVCGGWGVGVGELWPWCGGVSAQGTQFSWKLTSRRVRQALRQRLRAIFRACSLPWHAVHAEGSHAGRPTTLTPHDTPPHHPPPPPHTHTHTPRGCGRRRKTLAPRPSSCRRGRGP